MGLEVDNVALFGPGASVIKLFTAVSYEFFISLSDCPLQGFPG